MDAAMSRAGYEEKARVAQLDRVYARAFRRISREILLGNADRDPVEFLSTVKWIALQADNDPSALEHAGVVGRPAARRR